MARWHIEYFQNDEVDPPESIPARVFLFACPEFVASKFYSILNAVAEAPPPSFKGGGYWEAMHGDMAGYYELRVDGPHRRHYRLFCLLEHRGAEVGLKGPTLIVLCGMEKPFRTTFSKRDYDRVRALGERFRSRVPRPVVR